MWIIGGKMHKWLLLLLRNLLFELKLNNFAGWLKCREWRTFLEQLFVHEIKRRLQTWNEVSEDLCRHDMSEHVGYYHESGIFI